MYGRRKVGGRGNCASQGGSPPQGMPQLSHILEVEQDSQRTSPTLQPVTISLYAHVATDTQTNSSQTTNITHPQCITTKPTILTSAADAQTATQIGVNILVCVVRNCARSYYYY